MPCYTRQTSTVELGPQTDTQLLRAAVEELGYRTSNLDGGFAFSQGDTAGLFTGGTFREGKLSVVGSEKWTTQHQHQLQRAYSAQVVKAAAKRFGWAVKQPNPNQFQVTRRG